MRVPRSTKLKQILQLWTKKFEVQNIPDPRSSAEYIIAHAIGNKTLFGVDPCMSLTKPQAELIHRLCKMRLMRMPVQYILGEWDFHDLTLKMKPPVLIPRPETEELASLCMDTLSKLPTRGQVLLEVGPGTGAISLALLKKFKEIKAIAVDISEEACDLTQLNSRLIGVHDRLTVIQGDVQDNQVLESLGKSGPFCFIVSNPPYISTAEMDTLQDEVCCFEDHRALHGGGDGMSLILKILQMSAQLLQTDGHLWLEVGPVHPPLIEAFISDPSTWEGSPQKLTYAETVTDLYGNNRFCHLVSF